MQIYSAKCLPPGLPVDVYPCWHQAGAVVKFWVFIVLGDPLIWRGDDDACHALGMLH